MLTISVVLVLTGLLLQPWRHSGVGYIGVKARWGAWGMVLSGLVLGARAIW